MRKTYVLLIFVAAALFFTACSNKKEGGMDNILKEISSAGQSLELITSYDMSDHITYYTIVIYNGEKKEKSYSYSKKKELESYTTYEYNENGNLTKEFIYTARDVLLSTRHIKYDEQNRMAQYFVRSEDIQEIYYTTLCEYDNNDNLIKTKEYQEPIEEENLYSFSEYEYEDKRLMAVKNYLNISEEKRSILNSYYENECDEEGRVCKRSFYNADGQGTNYLVFEYKN